MLIMLWRMAVRLLRILGVRQGPAADEAPVEVLVFAVALKDTKLVLQGEWSKSSRGASSAVPGGIAALLGSHGSWGVPSQCLHILQAMLLLQCASLLKGPGTVCTCMHLHFSQAKWGVYTGKESPHAPKNRSKVCLAFATCPKHAGPSHTCCARSWGAWSGPAVRWYLRAASEAWAASGAEGALGGRLAPAAPRMALHSCSAWEVALSSCLCRTSCTSSMAINVLHTANLAQGGAVTVSREGLFH